MEQCEKIDTEVLIMEIEKRPAIWNLSCEEYSNKNSKRKCWQDIVDLFGGVEMANAEKEVLGEFIQKKWKHIRDSYSREMRQQKDMKSGSSTLRYSPYVYTRQLSFLSACTSQVNTTGTITQETTDSVVNNSDEGMEGPYNTNTSERKKAAGKKKKEDPDPELACVLKASLQRRVDREHISDNDADRQFLLSLLPHMKKVPEYRKLVTQMEILEIINRNVGYAPGNIAACPSRPTPSHMSQGYVPPQPAFRSPIAVPVNQQMNYVAYPTTSWQTVSNSDQQPPEEQSHRPRSAMSFESSDALDSPQSDILTLFK